MSGRQSSSSSPATFFSVLSGTSRFSGHLVFDDSVRQTAEKSDVFFGVVDSVSSGASLLASRAVSEMQLRARRGLGPSFADDRVAERGELVSGDSVLDQLLCDGSSGAMPSLCHPVRTPGGRPICSCA